MTTRTFAAALVLGGLLASGAHADPRPPDPAKLQSGGRPVRKGPPPIRPSAAAASRAPYPLELRFLGADAGPARFTTDAGQTLTLTLELTNHGSARQFELAALTWAMAVGLPGHVTLAPGETTHVSVTVTKRACQPRASFLEVVASADGDSALPVKARASVRCR
jgi:hypothetical protein